MANIEHLKILNQGVKKWNEWRKTNDDIRPDLSYSDLSGKILKDVQLYNVNLSHAILNRAYLNGANLFEADLSHASLKGVNLREAILCRANLNNADLSIVEIYGPDFYAMTDIVGADLSNATFKDANLSEAQMTRSDLTKTDFSRAKLHGANFNNSTLYKTVFRGADLSNTNHKKTDFSGSYLEEVDFYGANLENADFFRARIARSNLEKANIRNILLGYTGIDDVDLREIKGLDKINHGAPSTISNKTFIKSEGNISQEFLKGVGLSDWEIETINLYKLRLTPDQITDIAYKVVELKNDSPILLFPVFLSHSGEDKVFARKLFDGLQKRNVRCWLDEKETKPGDRIIRIIDQAIKHYDKLLLICSEKSLTSWWVERELERILLKEKEYNKGKKEEDKVNLIIPITIDDYIFKEWDSPWKVEVKRYIIGDFRTWKDNENFQKSLDQLVDGLKVNPSNFKPPSYL